MQKYIESGLITKEGKAIKCLSYKYYLKNKFEFDNPLNNKRISYLKKISYLNEEKEYYGEEINNKHDKLFKDLFSDKEEVAKFINKYLNLKTTIEKDDIEPYNNSYVTKLYQSKEADIVYKMKKKNIFFLIEHQSTVDRAMPFRMENYKIAIMNQAVEKEKMKLENYKYPRVIAMVLYTGKADWKAKINLNDIQDTLPGYIEKNQTYTLLDVNKYDNSQLVDDDLLISKAMLMEKSKTKEEIMNNLEIIADKILKDDNNLQGEHLLDVFLNYIIEANIRKEAKKLIEDIRKKKGDNENMLNFVRVIEEENAAQRKADRDKFRKDVIARMLEKKLDDNLIKYFLGINNKELKKLKNQ